MAHYCPGAHTGLQVDNVNSLRQTSKVKYNATEIVSYVTLLTRQS